MDGVYGLRVRLDGPPKPLDAVEEQLTLLVVQEFVVEALDCFLKDATRTPLVNYTGGAHRTSFRTVGRASGCR